VTGSPLKLSYLYCVKQVLIITYYWPPSGGAGVQRWLKFSGYLAGMGFEPVVLTVDPDFATYPVIDKTLESEIPSGVKVFKTKATDYFRLFSRNKSAMASFRNSHGSLGVISLFPTPGKGGTNMHSGKHLNLLRVST